jgi:hypothetical protein
MMNLKMAALRQDSNNINCDHSERLNEDFMIVSEAFNFDGNLDDALFNKLGSSTDNKIAERKQIINTDCYVRRYSELSNVLENRKNPLLQDKGKITQRVFLDQSAKKKRCGCDYPDTCKHCNGYVSRKDRPTRYDAS